MFESQYRFLWKQDDHPDPAYNPLRTWILQLVLIMILTQLLSLLLKKLRQPRVIAEVCAGILLSPSALGRIPRFTDTFFPEISKPYLFLIADIGLILFLFLIGLEIEGSAIRKTVSLSTAIALGGIILPFGLGSALSVPIYNYFVDPTVEFTHFFLFIGIAFSITAFPVLCRILTELKLLDTTVGVVVLSAGVLNDIFGWILLALSLTLARSTSSLAALWILMYCIAWVFFLAFPVRRLFSWLAHWSGSIDNGPSILFITVAMLTMFCSAFLTDLIGVHAIFGAFLVGLIMPREGGLAIALTEKLEDMVSILFLPLYFTASGLSTDFGLLNDRITWLFTLGIILSAWTGKFGGGFLAARMTGFRRREAATIGTLLSCKGLIELIVLNVGLSAGILNTRVFSMFVLEALTLTFLTTPMVMVFYPPQYRKKVLHEDSPVNKDPESSSSSTSDFRRKSHITIVLDRMDELPIVMSFMELLNDRTTSQDSDSFATGSRRSSRRKLTLHGPPSVKALRLIELSERSSDVMKSSAIDRLLATDSLLGIFRTYCNINGIDVSTSLSVIPLDEFASKVVESTSGHSSELILIPWSRARVHHTHDVGGEVLNSKPQVEMDSSDRRAAVSGSHLHFLQDALLDCQTDSIVLIDRGTETIGHQNGHHFILPFFGGMHDRLALRLVLQLCAKDGTTATVIRIPPHDPLNNRANVKPADVSNNINSEFDPLQREVSPDPAYQTFLDTEQSADDDLWRELKSESNSHMEIRDALQRVELLEKENPLSFANLLLRLHLETGKALTDHSKRPFIILSRESGHGGYSGSYNLGSQGSGQVMAGDIAPEVVGTLGILPSAVFAGTDDRIGLIIVQSGRNAGMR